MKSLTGLLIFSALLIGASASGQENDARAAKLKRLLKLYPDADTNKDGLLTGKEAKVYRRKMMAGMGQQGDPDKKGKGIAPTQENIKYGSHTRNVLDLFKAKATQPAPVLICFHGGGFVAGDKEKFRKDKLTSASLDCGISVIAANYRFVKGEGASPFPGPMLDGARVIQFVRSKAKEWNIDPTRIALTGGSAGANMSMWIAMHDNLADPKSTDPVCRFSSRVTCVIGKAGQTSNDPFWILKNIGGNPTIHSSLLAGYGVTSSNELKKPEIQKLIVEASAMSHATKDDPPLMLLYPGTPSDKLLPAETPIEISIHHANFGRALKGVYKELGLECHFHHAGHPPHATSETEFLKKHFEMK